MVEAQPYYLYEGTDELAALKRHALAKISMFRRIQAETNDLGGTPDASIADLIAYNEAVITVVDKTLTKV